jgi:ubiquinone biosynthesis protein
MGRYAEAFLEYPFQISELLDEFKDGEIEITVRPVGFKEAVDKIQAGTNRVVLALIAAALLLGSSIVSVFAQSADVAGLSLLAIPGFLLGLAIVVWLCVGIFRSGRW